MKEVTAAILIKENKVLIARRSTKDKLAGKWEFPGGKLEEGETLQECLKREMKEEFRIEVSVGEFFGESIYRYDNGEIRLMAYFTEWTSGNLIPMVHDEIAWATADQLDSYDFAPADQPFAERLRDGFIH